MQAVMAVMLDAMQTDAQRLERIGVNLANVATPGFQREILLASRVGSSVGEPVAPQVVGAHAIGRDLRPGTLRATGQPWDLALTSPGYFELSTPHGPLYTRRGDFSVDAQGRLVSAQGWPVMGMDGEIRPGTGQVVVETTGRMLIDGKVAGQLKVAVFAEPESLVHVESGNFSSSAQPRVLADSSVRIRQGQLENANVNQGREMIELMQTMRHFESISRMLQGYDDMIGNAVRKLGEV